ncbi:uncharacterized protein LOC135377612 [Ornithodoros turicata]|uniref:uncharacterized protein LOC135377612 n=1 Tax=Ornithodoros turicata TaxID=34597 RepID=UPI003139B11D
MTVDQAERGCRAVCIALLYLIGMLLIIAGIAAGIFTQTYPDLLLYLAIAAGAAIIMGLLFVAMSAVVCTRKKHPPRKSSMAFTPESYSPSPINNVGSRPDLILPLESVTDSSKVPDGKSDTMSDVNDGWRAEKGEYQSMNSVGLPASKKAQKPATSSPRLLKAKGPQSLNNASPSLPDIPRAGQKANNSQNTKPRSSQGKQLLLTGTSSISDFSSLAMSGDDVVFDSTPPERSAPRPTTTGRGRVPLTAFKHASRSVSDLDDDVSLEPVLKSAHKDVPRSARQMEPRLAVSCHNILSEEPVRVGIHHVRQREAVTRSSAAKPPVPRKVAGVALPGLAKQPKSATASHSENDLLRQPELSTRPNEGVRPVVPRKPNVRYIPKSVPDLLDSSGEYNGPAEPSKKTITVTVISRSTNPLPASGAPCAEFTKQTADLERCNMIGLPLPLSLPPRQATSTNSGVSEGTAVRTLKSTITSQPEWAPSVSSRSNTMSSEDSHGPFNNSQDLLLEGHRNLMETEI